MKRVDHSDELIKLRREVEVLRAFVKACTRDRVTPALYNWAQKLIKREKSNGT